MSTLQSLARRIGLPGLEFEIDEYSRGKIMRASILPFAIVLAILTRTALEIIYGQNLRFFYSANITNIPDSWWWVYKVAYAIPSIEWVALASLFLLGIGRWRRNEATWMLLVAATLAWIAFLAAIYTAVAYIVLDNTASVGKVRANSVGALAYEFSLLSIGYAFIAYRGLAVREPRRRLRRARRPAPSPSFQRPAPGPEPAES